MAAQGESLAKKESASQDQTDKQHEQYKKTEQVGSDNSLRKLNRDLFNMINADSGRYSKFSDFLWTLCIFGAGILFSIFIGVTRGRSSKELTDLVSKIQGQKGKYEQAKKKYLG